LGNWSLFYVLRIGPTCLIRRECCSLNFCFMEASTAQIAAFSSDIGER
jgi:hypothetical protein